MTAGGLGNEEEVSIKEIIIKLQAWGKYIFSKWYKIVFLMLLGAFAGWIYSFSKKPVFAAELTFALEEEGGGGMGAYASLAGQFGVDVGGGGGSIFAGDNLILLMRSKNIVFKTLLTSVDINGTAKPLIEHYIDFKELRNMWKEANSPYANIKFPLGLKPENFSLGQSSLMNGFYSTITSKNLVIEKKDLKAGIISINVNSEDELFSLYFAKALAKEVSDFYIETKTKKSVQNLVILQHQTDSVKGQFNSSLSGMAASTDANPNLNPARQVLRVPSQRKQLDIKINEAILTQLVQNLEIAKVSLRKETPLIQIIDSPTLPLDSSEFSKSRAIILGGILGAFLSMLFFTGKMIHKNIMA